MLLEELRNMINDSIYYIQYLLVVMYMKRVITHVTAQLLKLLLFELFTPCLRQIQLVLYLSLQLVHLLSHYCPNTQPLLLLSIVHTLNTQYTTCSSAQALT